MGGIKNQLGQRFGKLTVIRKIPPPEKIRDSNWLCKCDCGNEVSVLGGNLKRTNSCGCLTIENRKHKDVIGMIRGRLTVIKELPSVRTKGGSSYRIVLCRCECGNEVEKRLTSLFYNSNRSGFSCGCLKTNPDHSQIIHDVDYGIREHPTYGIWKGMKQRCNNPKNERYKNYGERGVSIDAIWDKFQDFYYWAIQNGWENGLTIERINNDGNYEPSNCKWATWDEQANNKTTTVFVWLGDIKMSLTHACRKLGLTYRTIQRRMKRDGLTFNQAIAGT